MNEVRVKVRAINNIPRVPPCCSFSKLNCLITEGTCISYIPKRLKAKNTNNRAIKRLTHGFAAIWLAPEAPNVMASIKPKDVKITIIPNA